MQRPIPRNPRKFSFILAFAVALGVILSGFVSICFQFGNGNFAAGVSSAAEYLAIFGFGLIVLAVPAGMVALLLGRFIGVTITALIAVGGFLTLIVMSYFESTPISRFQRFVWKAAPRSLPIYEHQMLKSFSDGTTYTFVLAANSQTINEIRDALQLSKVTADFPLLGNFPEHFPNAHFPQQTVLYKGGNIEVAYVPSEEKAYVVKSPTARTK